MIHMIHWYDFSTSPARYACGLLHANSNGDDWTQLPEKVDCEACKVARVTEALTRDKTAAVRGTT